jgi:hydrogenase maturation protease
MNHKVAIRSDISVSPVEYSLLVLGLGNTLLGDDGVGVHVARQLGCDPGTPQWLQPLDGGTLGFRLLDSLRQADAVLIVDAAQLGACAGTMRLIDHDELIQHVSVSGRSSTHEAGLADLLTLARLEGFAPKHLALLGIQPQTIDWCETLSPAVASAVSAASQLAVSTGIKWLSEI